MDGMVGNIGNTLNLAQMKQQKAEFKNLQKSFDLKEKTESKDKLMDAAQNFESVFVNQLLQIMDKTIQRSDFMSGGSGEKIFRQMFYQEIAKDISKNPNTSFGMAKQVYEQLSQQL